MPKDKKRVISEYEKGYERGYGKGLGEGMKQGETQGYEFAMVILLMVLKDKHDACEEDLRQLNQEINSYTDLIRTGRIKFSDMRKALYDDYRIKFRWR